MKILIAGASGFIGQAVVKHLSVQHQVLKLVRKTAGLGEIFWNPNLQQIEMNEINDVDVVINLCGENILGRWNDKKKHAIYDSRILPTKFLCKIFLNHPPRVFIQASAVGFYGDHGDQTVDENCPHGNDFLAHVCNDWERAAQLMQAKTRLVFTRFGMVLDNHGGALGKILPIFKLGIGGKMGSGRQYMSWISLADAVRAIDHILQNNELSGPINIVAPDAITNAQFTKDIGTFLNRPTFLSIPQSILKLFLSDSSSAFTSSIRVRPQKLIDTHFQFNFTDLTSVLVDKKS